MIFKKLIIFLILLAPATLVSFISGMALIDGVNHLWLTRTFTISSILSVLAVFYASGLLAALHTRFIEKEKGLDLANESFSANEQHNRKLQVEIEKLTGMREIQMSSHIANFSDLLHNILNITHIATEARALTIFLESHDQIGMLYPKTHIRWEPTDSKLPGKIFSFFDNELILHNSKETYFEDFSLDAEQVKFNMNNRLIRSNFSFEGENFGEIEYSPSFGFDNGDNKLPKKFQDWLKTFKLRVSGVYSCWQTRSPVTHECEGVTMISVPILTQGLLIGVLSAEFVGLQRDGSFNEELRRYTNILLDYGRNIGQPLKKEELYEQAIKDAMTGLFNRAHYESQLSSLFHRMVRYERDLSFIFMDIDHFKLINDNYGHSTGDIALKYVSRILMESIRNTDIAFRIGGEELCVLLIETDIDKAMAVAEKLRVVIEETDFPKDGGGHINFTASFGVACINSTMKNPEDLAKAADQAVYYAKDNGRNRVISWDAIKPV